MGVQKNGFTIVEITLAISVIGILATIGILAWGGAQTWSQNSARYTELSQWANTFDLYKSKFSTYPGMPADQADGMYYYCLGMFTTTSNKCGEYTSASTNKYRFAASPDGNGTVAETIRTELTKVGQVPTNAAPPINNVAIGPYVVFTKSTAGATTTISAAFIGLFKGGLCPNDTVQETSPPMGALGDIIACKITRSITY